MSETSIDLVDGLVVDGEHRQTVTMRKPRVRDIEAMKKHSKEADEQSVFLLSALCELTPDQVKDLTLEDFDRLQTEAEKMFPSGRKTSGRSSPTSP